ncbi:MAG: hypothetical protein JSV78_12980, partial [Phycisphaerales bacterium]
SENDRRYQCFWSPVTPPKVSYAVDCRIDPDAGQTSGSEIIRFTNTTPQPLQRLLLSWPVADHASGGRTIDVTVGGAPVTRIDGHGPVTFDLPEALPPEKPIEIHVMFGLKGWPKIRPDGDEVITNTFLPTLDWGFPTHADYDVKLLVPPEYAVATSGRFDPADKSYRARNVRAFGLYLGRGHKVLEQQAGETLVRCVYRPAAEECARLLTYTAVDVVNFYRERFGFYPYRVLNIVPGMKYPAGGYPVATNLVVVHGQQQFDKRPELHWRWITAHEIGHMYWGEYVLEREDPGWLWIALGIYADHEYTRARGLSPDKHRGLMHNYVNAVWNGHDTTVALTLAPERINEVEFDWNNLVQHGKGFSIISALACVLGQETFDRAYVRCLNEFHGRRLGPADFQRICEKESGQDLQWFFDQWLWTDRYPAYEISEQSCVKEGEQFVTRVQVSRLGSLEMPVPVEVRFEDGSKQRRFSDRLLKTSELVFYSDSVLKEAVLDPDGELAMVIPLPKLTARKVIQKVGRMSWSGAGEEAMVIYETLPDDIRLNTGVWAKLGLNLYDGRHYVQALRAFEHAADSAEEGDLWSFVAFVWQGHIHDLEHRRETAIRCYQTALQRDTGGTMQHSQYDMYVNRKWIEERLETPFSRD